MKFREKLGVMGIGGGIEGFRRSSVAAGSALCVACIFVSLFILESENLAFASLAVFFVPPALYYFYIIYLWEARAGKIEEHVPDILLLASSLPEGTSPERLVGFMAKHAEEPLKGEFEIAQGKISRGMPVETALESMAQRNGSLSLRRAVNLLNGALRTGAEMNSAFRETAEDFMQTNAIIRERAANATMQKYTLLLAGGLIVPLILGLLAGMIPNLNFGAISETGLGVSESARKDLLESALLANIIYIAEYSVIASCFTALQEGKGKKASIYAMALVPAGLAVYFIAKGI